MQTMQVKKKKSILLTKYKNRIESLYDLIEIANNIGQLVKGIKPPYLW